MIQGTDFQEKQILFIDPKEGAGKFGIKLQNSNLLLTRNEKAENKISLHKLLTIFVLGDMTLSTKIIEGVQKHGASMYLLKRNFAQYAHFGADADANYLARIRQYALTNQEELQIAKHIIKNKIKNQARLLEIGQTEEVKNIIMNIDNAKTPKELLGIEGSFARKFFSEYFNEISWRRRAPRTREDIPNLLLDIGYTILFNFIDSLSRLYGLDLYKGIYHTQFFARKSLVTDLEEPFRCIIDKALLKGYRLGIVNEEDFTFNNKKQEFMLPWKNANKYYRLFSDEIMGRKMEIFEFIQAFYRHIMLPKKNKLKNFNINKEYHKK